MKRLSYVALMLLLVPVYAGAQFVLSGKITDKQSKEPIPGAKIYLKNSFKVTVTDEKGFYVFSKLKKGAYIVETSSLGFNNETKELLLEQNEILDFELTASVMLADEVIITATRANEKTPATYQDINKREISELNLGQDLPSILQHSISAVSTSDAGNGVGYTGLRIRGTDMTRINVTLNGVPYNEAETQEVYWVDIPDVASSTENIQIQRGVGTSNNGPAAFGASINLLTNKLNPLPYSEAGSSFGSFNTSKNSVSFGTGLINNSFAFDGRLSKIYSDGYMDRAYSDLKSYYLSGSWYFSNSFIKFITFSGKEKTYQSWAGIPKDSLISNRTYNPYTYKNQTDNYQQDHYQLFYSSEINNKLNLNLALHLTDGEGYYENFKNKNDPYPYAYPDVEFKDYGLNNYIAGNDTITESDFITRKWLDNRFYGALYSLNYKMTNKLNIISGGAYNQYKGNHFGKVIWSEYPVENDYEWYRNKGNKEELSFYLKLNYTLLKSLNIYGDMQYRNIKYSIKGIHDNLLDITQTHNFDFFNPKAGFIFDINENNSAYFSFAVSNREPNRSNYQDADEGYVPQAERLYDFELGHSLKSRYFLFNFNLYYMNYKEQLVLTGEINKVGAPVMTNVDNSYRRGVELAMQTKFNKFINWNSNLSLSENKILDFVEYVDNYDKDWNALKQIETKRSKTDIAFSPSVIAGSRLNFTAFKKLNIALISKYVSRQYIDNTANKERSLDPYFINNILVNYTFKCKFIKEIRLEFMINNLFNEKYETNAWVYKYYLEGAGFIEENGYYPQATTNFIAGIKLNF